MTLGESMTLPLLPTSLVGSYAQPEWLIDRAKLAGRFPPRTRQKESPVRWRQGRLLQRGPCAVRSQKIGEFHILPCTIVVYRRKEGESASPFSYPDPAIFYATIFYSPIILLTHVIALFHLEPQSCM